MFKFLDKKNNKKKERETKEKLHLFSTFYPNSQNYWSYPELTYSAANNLPSQLIPFIENKVKIENYTELDEDKNLGELFEKYGSDKNRNGYSPIYSYVLKNINKKELNILEIGLGTNNPAVISSMGLKGKPGASLRAFRDYLPGGNIYGADIDKEILFSEDRIKTGWIDQIKKRTFGELVDHFENPLFDLIIDDGLHSSEANLNTLAFWQEHAQPGTWIVIEDIPERTLDVWRVASSMMLNQGHECKIYRAVAGYVVVARKT